MRKGLSTELAAGFRHRVKLGDVILQAALVKDSDALRTLHKLPAGVMQSHVALLRFVGPGWQFNRIFWPKKRPKYRPENWPKTTFEKDVCTNYQNQTKNWPGQEGKIPF